MRPHRAGLSRLPALLSPGGRGIGCGSGHPAVQSSQTGGGPHAALRHRTALLGESPSPGSFLISIGTRDDGIRCGNFARPFLSVELGCPAILRSECRGLPHRAGHALPNRRGGRLRLGRGSRILNSFPCFLRLDPELAERLAGVVAQPMMPLGFGPRSRTGAPCRAVNGCSGRDWVVGPVSEWRHPVRSRFVELRSCPIRTS